MPQLAGFKVQCICDKECTDKQEFHERWFRVGVPDRLIEELPEVLFAMPMVEFCSAHCLKNYADELIKMGMK
jgi:FMN-dependent NADH-azoreductase